MCAMYLIVGGIFLHIGKTSYSMILLKLQRRPQDGLCSAVAQYNRSIDQPGRLRTISSR